MQNKSKLNTILLVIIIILLAVVLVFFFSNNSKIKDASNLPKENGVEVNNISQETLGIITDAPIQKNQSIKKVNNIDKKTIEPKFVIPDNWKTYSDENYGFEFSYPADINIDLNDIGIRGEIGAVTDFKVLDDSVNSNIAFRSKNGIPAIISSVKIDNQEAKTICDSNGICELHITFPKPLNFMGSGRYFKFLVIGDNLPQKYLTQIISTFKFTK